MRANLAPFHDRVKVVETGVWEVAARLVVERGNFGDGREWSYTVRECGEGEQHDLVAADMCTLLDLTAGQGNDVDIVKIDIEGAERQIFADPTAKWIGRARNLVIEIHGEEAEQLVSAAFPSAEWERSASGELSVFRRRDTSV